MMTLAQIGPLALEGNGRLAAAILMGIAFGFILVKGDFPFSKPVRETLTLKGGAVSKSFILSIGVGALLFYFLYKTGLVQYHVRPAYLWPSILGGILSGLGMALCLVVPVTAVAALASGRIYALWAILGMLLAVPCVNAAANWLSGTIFQWGTELGAPEHMDDFLNFSNPVLWVVIISGVLVTVLHFTLRGSSSGTSGGEKKEE